MPTYSLSEETIRMMKEHFRSSSVTDHDTVGRPVHFLSTDRSDEFVSDDNPLGIFVEEAWWMYVEDKHLVLYKSVSPKFGEFKEVRVVDDYGSVVGYANSEDVVFTLGLLPAPTNYLSLT